MPSSTNFVPNFDAAVHVVLDDFGTAGRTYRETDESDASFARVVSDLLAGLFSNPVRVVAFNTDQGWSRDVSEGVAREVAKQAAERGLSLSAGSRRFVTRHVDEHALQAETFN